MNKFIKNIIDQVQEMQLKLGFADESVSLYYPYDSIRYLLESDLPDEALPSVLEDVIRSSGLGEILLKSTKNRVVVTLTPSAVAHIHNNYPPTDFLKEIITLFSKHHGITVDDISSVFKKYNSDYRLIKMQPGSDFDYVFYFSDGQPDDFYYCVKDEFGHMIYHRFIKSDYEALRA